MDLKSSALLRALVMALQKSFPGLSACLPSNLTLPIATSGCPRALSSCRSLLPPPAAVHAASSTKAKTALVFSDESKGIVCYRAESGEVTCEGFDEGPYFHRSQPSHSCDQILSTSVAWANYWGMQYMATNFEYNIYPNGPMQMDVFEDRDEG